RRRNRLRKLDTKIILVNQIIQTQGVNITITRNKPLKLDTVSQNINSLSRPPNRRLKITKLRWSRNTKILEQVFLIVILLTQPITTMLLIPLLKHLPNLSDLINRQSE